jgi:alkylation response protein AidB-like acyl-CoA dehydrogenase
VEVRPLRQLTGDTEFNEVYLENVRVDDGARLGDVGAGWRVCMPRSAACALANRARRPR